MKSNTIIYSGRDAHNADIIGRIGLDTHEISEIANEILLPFPGEIRLNSNYIPLDMDFIDGIYRVKENSNFDGWVYLDGSYFYCSDFPEISAEYAQCEDDIVFRIPDYSSFIKCFNTDNENEDYANDKPGKNIPQKHVHNISENGKLKTSFEVPNGFQYKASSGCSKQFYVMETHAGLTYPIYLFHNGKRTADGKKLVSMTANVTLNLLAWLFSNAITETYGIENGEFSPTHINIPAMVYLGKPVYTEDRPIVKFITLILKDGKYYDYDMNLGRHVLSLTTDNVLETMTIPNMNNILLPAIQFKEGYDADGYDDIAELMDDSDIYVHYKQKTYTITIKYIVRNDFASEKEKKTDTYVVGHGQSLPDEYLNAYKNTNAGRYRYVGYEFSSFSSDDIHKNVKSNIVIVVNYALKVIDDIACIVTGAPADAYLIICPSTALYDNDIEIKVIFKDFYVIDQWVVTAGENVTTYDGSDNRTLVIKLSNATSFHIEARSKSIDVIQDQIWFYKNDATDDMYLDTVLIQGTPTGTLNKLYITTTTISTEYKKQFNKTLPSSNIEYFKVDWDDGNIEYIKYSSITHYYSTSGTYDVKIIPVLKLAIDLVDSVGYSLYFDLNGGKCARYLNGLYYVVTDDSKNIFSSEIAGKTNTKYPVYTCVIPYNDDGRIKTLTLSGVYRNFNNSQYEYYYYDLKNTNLKGFSFENGNLYYIPSGEYPLYQTSAKEYKIDKSCVKIGKTYATRTLSKKSVNIYNFKETWFPIDDNTTSYAICIW